MFVVSECWRRAWRRLVPTLLALGLLFPSVSPVCAQTMPPAVLVIDPSAGGAGGMFYQQALASFRAALNQDQNQHASVYVESLQLGRFGGATYEAQTSAYLASKYKDIPIAVIVAFGGAALQFASKLRAEHWPDVPVVFTMLDPNFALTMRLPRNVTGVTSNQKLSDNVNLARALMPDLARIAIVSDAFETLVGFRSAKEELPGIVANGLEAIDLSGMRMSDLRERVAKLPPRTAIAYLSVNSDGEGGMLLPYEALQRISDVANRPIFIVAESQIGHGAVGGWVLVPTRVGESVGPLVRRILNGERASSIPVTQDEVIRPIFDWRQLQRWGISENQLPPGSEVRFREFSVWERYRLQVALILAAILVQGVLISWLFYEQRRRRLAEVQARDFTAELTYMNRRASAGELSASIAHEINQPLTGILTRASAALRWLRRDEPDLGRAEAALQQIVQASERAGVIVKGVRAMFAKDAGEVKRVDLNDLILAVLELVRIDIQSAGVNLHLRLDDKFRAVMGDEIQLQQVILNLVMNAIEAMRSVPRRILTVKSEQAGPALVRVVIADTGPGIDPSNLDRIFKPLFTTKSRGMGMGLSICHSIIEHHGGRIWVSSMPNGGAIFQFELPTAPEKRP